MISDAGVTEPAVETVKAVTVIMGLACVIPVLGGLVLWWYAERVPKDSADSPTTLGGHHAP